MDVPQMREKCAEAYSGDRWKRRVKFMPDDQIVALYLSLKQRGRIKDAG